MANRVQVKVNEDGLPVVATGGDRESRQTPGAAPRFTEKLMKARKGLVQSKQGYQGNVDRQGGLARLQMGGSQASAPMTSDEMRQLESEMADRLKPGQATTFYYDGKQYNIRNTPRKGFEYGEGPAPLTYPSQNPDAREGDEVDYERVDYWD